ncbi:hypothetical protein CEXT_355221 [Caerostris extrusa]|uniref:Uncharacterized protein n=1 Tax=Caerostris extrusa TaxID=172846 RepID=A0AAV4UD80_CAEEX|nr:hypothetical protein CEXT_355221 [Caerostris extrusa]
MESANGFASVCNRYESNETNVGIVCRRVGHLSPPQAPPLYHLLFKRSAEFRNNIIQQFSDLQPSDYLLLKEQTGAAPEVCFTHYFHEQDGWGILFFLSATIRVRSLCSLTYHKQMMGCCLAYPPCTLITST